MKILFLFLILVGNFSLSAQPSNDNKADAITLTNLNSWYSTQGQYTNIGATADGYNASHNVWFKFVATTSEIEIKVFTGGSRGTIENLYTYLFDDANTLIASNVVNSPTSTSTCYIQYQSLTLGSTYHFYVDNFAGNSGTFTLEVSNHIGNDLKAKAIVLNDISLWQSGNAQYTNIDATRDEIVTSDCGQYYSNVWFKFTATTSELDFRLLFGGDKGSMSDVNALTLLDASGTTLYCSNNVLQYVQLIPGNIYHLSVDGPIPNSGTFSISVDDHVSNDLRLKATQIKHLNNWASADAAYSNVNATLDPLGSSWLSSCADSRKDVWFKFQATTANVNFWILSEGIKGTLGTFYATLYDASGTSLKCLGAFTDATLESTTLTPGAWYFVAVDSYASDAGTFSVRIEGGLPVNEDTPPTQLCSNLYCDNNGNVGIGQAVFANGYKLSVSGKIIAEGVKVQLNANWPDYVFQREHELIEISELTAFINENGHLPNVPTAKTVEKDGLDLGSMNIVMMEKIEELTLYIIQLEERLKKLEHKQVK
jgi:hypothetical protein